jgi:CHAT domain-containing protein
MRALCHRLVTANRWQALLDQREAFTILTDARQTDASRQLGSHLLDSLTLMGRDTEADALLEKILYTLSLDDVPVRTYTSIDALIEHLAGKGLEVASLEVLDRSQGRIAKAMPELGVEAARHAVELANAINDQGAAARSIELAGRSLGAVADEQIRSEERIVLSLATSNAGLPAGVAEGGIDSLLAALRRRRNEGFLTQALTLLGEQRLAQGRPELAEPALREALDLLLASRMRTTGEFERVKQFEGAERTADDLVDTLEATGRSDEALALTEKLRHPDAPVRLPVLLPADQAAVSYWTLKDRVLVTVLTSGGTRHFSLPLDRLRLRNLLERLRASLDLESDVLAAAPRAELYHALVSPLLPALGGVQRVAIVADRDLWEIPFAGLAPSPDGQPLAARFEISFVASISSLRVAPAWTKPRSVLAIGSPSWDRLSFPDLRPLPESLTEAREVAALYERSRVLTGADATPAALQRVARGFDVVHVATHAVANDRDPGQSFILLSPDASSTGAWRAADSGWEALSSARLVVLSACRTGGERSRLGGVSLGVLRSIQVATRAQTLVSTGDVDDAASRNLLEAFHRHLLEGRTPAEALRQAQIKAYNEGSGMTWMLYRVVI